MSERDTGAGTDMSEPPPGMAGTLLRVAREAAGLSIDAVAQQLKLAPRQVKALEDGDFTHLPGRTFVRGFARAYARLVHLDPDRVLDALPAGAAANALAAPALQPTAPTIGELPTSDHAKASWARWAIPVTLAAIVTAAMTYEWLRPAGEDRFVAGPGAAKPESKPPAAVAPAAVTPAARDPASTPLPNPLAAMPAPPAPSTPGTPGTPAANPVPAPPAASTPDVHGSSGSAPPAEAPQAVQTSGEAELQLAFRDYSWTEVRDRHGRVLTSGMNRGGTSQTLNGTPPLEIVIGNAVDVTIRFRDQAVDLVPYTRQNVARLTLP